MPAAPETVLDRLARPALAYADRLATVEGEPLSALLRQAGVLIDRFETDAIRAGFAAADLLPARLALARVIDQSARANPALDPGDWASGARLRLFGGHAADTASLERIAGQRHVAPGVAPGPEAAPEGAAGRRSAEQPAGGRNPGRQNVGGQRAGAHADEVARFVAACLARIEDRRRAPASPRTASWLGIGLVLAAAFVLAVFGWIGWVEWRHNRALAAVFAQEELAAGLDRTGEFPDLAARLERLWAAAQDVRAGEQAVPVHLFATPLGFDAAARAGAGYDAALERHLPGRLARALDAAFAEEGDPVRLYDALRAWAILSGTAEWQPDWLSGWVDERSAADPALIGLATHAARLSPPAHPPQAPDAELLTQARAFAAEAGEAERAFLELRRSAEAAALPGWRADRAVEGLDAVVIRRSGRALSEPLPGLATAGGWAYARDGGAALALMRARDQAARLFSAPPAVQPDSAGHIMDLLQHDTLARWSAFLDDLRVRPFDNPETALLVSGRLALAASPIERLLREVWVQAGGTDRSRSHPRQIAVAVEFGPAIQYVEQGRMAEIEALFAGLNVALAARGRDAEDGQRRLMDVQERARSVAALQLAPRVVVGIVEDTLARTGAAEASPLTHPLTRAWQAEVLPLCTGAVAGFPFAKGPDADPAAVLRLLGPGGAMDRFLRERAEPLLDRSESPWRWKPEARFSGLSGETAVFFQTARALIPALGTGVPVSLTALAERGRAHVSLDGQGGAVNAGTDSLHLTWPGADPEAGVEIRFETPEGREVLARPGPWGLLHLLAPLRLRERDGGLRYLVDLRSGGARLFLEIGFGRAENPLSVRRLVAGFACPPVL